MNDHEETTLNIPLVGELRARRRAVLKEIAVTYFSAMAGVLTAIALVYLTGWWRP